MKKTTIAATLAGLLMISFVAQAWARCPPGTRYMCQQGFNGKVVCGCY